jgi:hypothetical protein
LELRSFYFLQKLSSIVQSRFLLANQGGKDKVNSVFAPELSIVIGAILDSAHVFKRKIQIPDP